MQQPISTSLLVLGFLLCANTSAQLRPVLQQNLESLPTTTTLPPRGRQQYDDCAYEPDAEYIDELIDPNSATNQRVQQVSNRPLLELHNQDSLLPLDDQGALLDGEIRIPLVIHILRRDDGSGGAVLGDVLSAIDTINNNYASFNLQFDACNIRYIDSTQLFNTRLWFPASSNPCGDPADGQQLAVDSRNISGKINIYVTPMSTSRGAGNDGSLCTTDDTFPNRSWTWRPTNATDNVLRQHIVLNNSSVSNGRTLGHEIGHWLGLLHTQGSSNNRPAVGVETNELVDGSNCESAGDFVCDTAADPNLAGRVDTSCNYTGSSQLMDNSGSPFRPDTGNRMSYSRGMCLQNWTQGQGVRLQAGYLGVREDRGYDLRLQSCDVGYEAASYVGQSAPSDMLLSTRYPVSVTFRNSGRSVWTPGYRLLSRENGFYLFKNGAVVNGIVMGRRVLPGETVTAQFEISAVSAGLFNYHWGIARPFQQQTLGSAIVGSVEVHAAGESASCAQLDTQISQLNREIRDLQAELHSASPAEKVYINQEVNRLEASIAGLERSKAAAGCS